jgi:hypothetical protein
MKRILIVLVAVSSIWGCKEKERQEIEALKQQVYMLESESLSKDSTINNFFRVLNEIETNISLVMQKEQVIAKNTAMGNEMEADTRERIQNDINTINELMTKNRQAMAFLNKQLKGANFKIQEFETRLSKTQELLETRDAEVVALKNRLANLDFSIELLNATVDTLNFEKELLQLEVQKHKSELYAAWFTFGSKKELLENGIIEKAGGFLGLGKSFRLKSDFNKAYFTQIDINEMLIIPLFSKTATLITAHPTESFEFEINENKIVERIVITNPTQFWSTSKYLVLQVE